MTTDKPVPIKLDSLTVNNLGIFNRITEPVEYPETYIKQCQENGELSRYAYFSEVPVGIIVLETVVNKSPVALNIKLLKVLNFYSWKFNVEKELIKYALDLCPKRHLSACIIVAKKSNKSLIDLLKEFGFKVVEDSPEAYKSVSVGEEEVLFVKNV